MPEDIPVLRAGLVVALGILLAGKAEHVFADSALDDVVEIDESAAADEQHVCRVELDVFLLGMFAPALRRDVADGALENL